MDKQAQIDRLTHLRDGARAEHKATLQAEIDALEKSDAPAKPAGRQPIVVRHASVDDK